MLTRRRYRSLQDQQVGIQIIQRNVRSYLVLRQVRPLSYQPKFDRTMLKLGSVVAVVEVVHPRQAFAEHCTRRGGHATEGRGASPDPGQAAEGGRGPPSTRATA
jgi:hypothetical protein